MALTTIPIGALVAPTGLPGTAGGGAGGGIDEAPTDGRSYLRVGSTASWAAGLPLTGGTLHNPAQAAWPNARTLIMQDNSPVLIWRDLAGNEWNFVGWYTWAAIGSRPNGQTSWDWQIAFLPNGRTEIYRGLDVTGNIRVTGDYYSLGSNASYEFQDRVRSWDHWILYANDGLASLYLSGANKFSVDTGGTAWAAGFSAANGWIWGRYIAMTANGYLHWQMPGIGWYMHNDNNSLIISANPTDSNAFAMWFDWGSQLVNCRWNLSCHARMTSADAVIATHHLWNYGGWLYTAQLRGGSIHSDGNIQGHDVIARGQLQLASGGAFWHNAGWMDCTVSFQAGYLYSRGDAEGHNVIARNGIGVNGLWITNNSGWVNASYLRADNTVEGHDVNARGSLWVSGCQLYNDGGWLRSAQSIRTPGRIDAQAGFATNGFESSWYGVPDSRFRDQEVLLQNSNLVLNNGNAWKPGGGYWAVYSDRRSKEFEIPYEHGLNEILQLNPMWFRYNGWCGTPTGITYVGVTADDVIDVMPEMVGNMKMNVRAGGDGSEMLTIDATPLLYALVNAVKTLAAEIATLKDGGK